MQRLPPELTPMPQHVLAQIHQDGVLMHSGPVYEETISSGEKSEDDLGMELNIKEKLESYNEEMVEMSDNQPPLDGDKGGGAGGLGQKSPDAGSSLAAAAHSLDLSTPGSSAAYHHQQHPGGDEAKGSPSPTPTGSGIVGHSSSPVMQHALPPSSTASLHHLAVAGLFQGGVGFEQAAAARRRIIPSPEEAIRTMDLSATGSGGYHHHHNHDDDRQTTEAGGGRLDDGGPSPIQFQQQQQQHEQPAGSSTPADASMDLSTTPGLSAAAVEGDERGLVAEAAGHDVRSVNMSGENDYSGGDIGSDEIDQFKRSSSSPAEGSVCFIVAESIDLTRGHHNVGNEASQGHQSGSPSIEVHGQELLSVAHDQRDERVSPVEANTSGEGTGEVCGSSYQSEDAVEPSQTELAAQRASSGSRLPHLIDDLALDGNLVDGSKTFPSVEVESEEDAKQLRHSAGDESPENLESKFVISSNHSGLKPEALSPPPTYLSSSSFGEKSAEGDRPVEETTDSPIGKRLRRSQRTSVGPERSTKDIDSEKSDCKEPVSSLGIKGSVQIKLPIFINELPFLMEDLSCTDTVIHCSDGSRRVHSFVLAAASSLFYNILNEVLRVTPDGQEQVILMPDMSLVELEQALRPIYGCQDDESASRDDLGVLKTFAVDYNKGNMEKIKMEASSTHKRVVAKEKKQADQGFSKFTIEPPVAPANIKQEPTYERKRRSTNYGVSYNEFFDDEPGYYGASSGFKDYKRTETTPEPPKRKRGRPRKVKEEAPSSLDYDDVSSNYIEPMVTVKEGVLDRSMDQFNEFFVQQQGEAGGKQGSRPKAAVVASGSNINFQQDTVGLYHCQAPECGLKTYVRASVQQHIRRTHFLGTGIQDSKYQCTRCGEGWAVQLYLQKHMDSHECANTAERPYICENCGKGWYNLANYTRHAETRECKKSTDTEGKHKCINCSFTFFSLRNRETHTKKAHLQTSDTSYRCAKCNINFKTHKEFNKHKKDLHVQGDTKHVNYSCRIPDCTFECEARPEFVEHVSTVHPTQNHVCATCGRNFEDAAQLELHNNSNTTVKNRCLPVNYTCPHCPREFNRKRHMELHILFKHTQERPFGCDKCGKRFKTRHCVNIHLRSHGIGGYSWCCEECGKTFNQISAYHVHLKVHSNVRDFACEDCGMTFKLKHSLKKHQLVHKAEFGHTCDFCGKKFKRSDNLINHRRRHTGEHPYKCDKCNWTGPDSSSFIHHKKKHMDTGHSSQEMKLIQAISKFPSKFLLERDPTALFTSPIEAGGIAEQDDSQM